MTKEEGQRWWGHWGEPAGLGKEQGKGLSVVCLQGEYTGRRRGESKPGGAWRQGTLTHRPWEVAKVRA